MTILSINLGSFPAEEGSVSAVSLSDVKTATPLTHGSLSSIHLNVLGCEVSSIWSNPMDMAFLAQSLQKDANVVVTIKSPEEAISLSDIHTSFLLAGLVGKSERKENDGSRVLTACKIPLQSLPIEAHLRSSNVNKMTTKITVNLNDDDQLINEESLLTDATNLIGVPDMNPVSTKDDCSGREPCENCSCGRAENKSEVGKVSKVVAETSACGKCSLGDAFRCASCPYLGKPAFKAGEERLILNMQDDF